jgi:hypothetical protein
LDACLASVDAAIKGLATPLTYIDFAGKLLSPGDYGTDAAMGMTGTLYLNVQDKAGTVVADPMWSLYITGTVTTGASSKVVFVNVDLTAMANFVGNDLNGAYLYTAAHLFYDPAAVPVIFFDPAFLSKTRVQWKIIGAITAGVGSKLVGDMKSNGAITVGANARIGGKLEALGAITLGPGAVVTGTLRATGAITAGTATYSSIYDPYDLLVTDSAMQGKVDDCVAAVATIKTAIEAQLPALALL